MLVLKILFIVLNTTILVWAMWEDIADDLRYRFKDNSRILKFLRLKPPKKKRPVFDDNDVVGIGQKKEDRGPTY